MVLLGPVGGLVINRVVSIIVWETLIKDVLEGLASGEDIVGVSGGGLWDSLHHHGKGNVIVVRDVLLLISSSLKDGVESVVSNDLSERLEGNGLDNILRVSWVNLQSDGLNLIDWHIGSLSEGIEWVSLGSHEVSLGWSSWFGWGSWLSLGLGSWGGLHVLLIVVVFVVL
jgi:membrane-associated protease RseP (regulator of RpoE activity)